MMNVMNNKMMGKMVFKMLIKEGIKNGNIKIISGAKINNEEGIMVQIDMPDDIIKGKLFVGKDILQSLRAEKLV